MGTPTASATFATCAASLQSQRSATAFSLGRAFDWDGRSVAGPLKGEADETWRTSVLVEYYFNDANDKCVADCAAPTTAYPGADVWCGDLEAGDACWGPAPNGGCVGACYPTENAGNNFLGLRKIGGGVDLLVCNEAHRCTGRRSKRDAQPLCDAFIPASRRLFLTATPRLFGSRRDAEGE